MAAEGQLAEALARVEHKLDLVLEVLARTVGTGKSFLLTPLADPNHTSPVCTWQVSYIVNIMDAVVTRSCGCKTGKIALDLRAFAPPAPPAKDTLNDHGTDQEDGLNAGGRGGTGQR